MHLRSSVDSPVGVGRAGRAADPSSVTKALELAVQLIALGRYVFFEALEPILELPVSMAERAERRMRLGANAAPYVLFVLVERRAHRPSLLRQQQGHDQIADDDERARKEQRAEHDEHADDHYIEAEVVG